jgi:hypothetical protein
MGLSKRNISSTAVAIMWLADRSCSRTSENRDNRRVPFAMGLVVFSWPPNKRSMQEPITSLSVSRSPLSSALSNLLVRHFRPRESITDNIPEISSHASGPLLGHVVILAEDAADPMNRFNISDHCFKRSISSAGSPHMCMITVAPRSKRLKLLEQHRIIVPGMRVDAFRGRLGALR